jgi:hypothetical protein
MRAFHKGAIHMANSKQNEQPVASGAQQITITAPDLRVLELQINGSANSALVINRFSSKQQAMVVATQEAGSVAKSRKTRTPKDFKTLYEECLYVSTEGWFGVNASCFRNAAISACRAAGYQMTKAKLGIFVIADGVDKFDHTPLVRIYGEPAPWIAPVRNATGVIDMRVRARFFPWSAKLRIRYDNGLFNNVDVCNLLMRVGQQVGIGEGRPDSKASAGIGMGLFDLASDVTADKAA